MMDQQQDTNGEPPPPSDDMQHPSDAGGMPDGKRGRRLIKAEPDARAERAAESRPQPQPPSDAEQAPDGDEQGTDAEAAPAAAEAGGGGGGEAAAAPAVAAGAVKVGPVWGDKHPSYINSNEALSAFCRVASKKRAIAVDTEFIMERHYWADLCLIQIGYMGGAAVIDPKMKGLQLDPLWRLLADPRVTKVFHAAYEDMVIIKHQSGILPLPAFDTQVAAMYCFNEDNPGYGTLVKRLFGETVDKSQQRSDWAKRPLMYKQVEYALHDVTYLIRAYYDLSSRLSAMDRLNWFLEDSVNLNSAGHYNHDPYLVWKRLSPRSPTPRGLAILREAAAWREGYARQRDMPARWILQDSVLEEIAHVEPRRERDMQRVRTLPPSFRSNRGKLQALWEAIERGGSIPEEDLPQTNRMRKDSADPRLLEMMRVLLNMLCRDYSIAPGIVANAADIRQAATSVAERAEASRILNGWRHQLYGNAVSALKQGRLRFGYVNNRVITTDDEGNDLVKVKMPSPELLLPRPEALLEDEEPPV